MRLSPIIKIILIVGSILLIVGAIKELRNTFTVHETPIKKAQEIAKENPNIAKHVEYHKPLVEIPHLVKKPNYLKRAPLPEKKIKRVIIIKEKNKKITLYQDKKGFIYTTPKSEQVREQVDEHVAPQEKPQVKVIDIYRPLAFEFHLTAGAGSPVNQFKPQFIISTFLLRTYKFYWGLGITPQKEIIPQVGIKKSIFWFSGGWGLTSKTIFITIQIGR